MSSEINYLINFPKSLSETDAKETISFSILSLWGMNENWVFLKVNFKHTQKIQNRLFTWNIAMKWLILENENENEMLNGNKGKWNKVKYGTNSILWHIKICQLLRNIFCHISKFIHVYINRFDMRYLINPKS